MDLSEAKGFMSQERGKADIRGTQCVWGPGRVVMGTVGLSRGKVRKKSRNVGGK